MPSKRELIIYGTVRPRGKFANGNAMANLGQVRDIWPSMAPLGHVEFGVNENALALPGQSRDSWLSMAPLGHVELTKTQKLKNRKQK